MKELVILTGYSGAGKSTAAGLLEDLGFFCIDNLPPEVIYQVASLVLPSVEKLAIVIDVRGYMFGNVTKAIKDIKERFPFTKVIFLTATKETLVQRFAHTRRSHPLSKQATSIMEAIDLEAEMMKDILEMADIVIDTSQMNPHQLREKLTKVLEPTEGKDFTVHIISFGFKYGIPLDADFVFDVRFFPNPFYIPELRPKDGRDEEVKEFLRNIEGITEYLNRIKSVILFAINRYHSEGRKELIIAIGCTGGKHRSVYFAEELSSQLEKENFKTTVEHRDVALG
ncbi:RNase adapter RapZ [Fervidobacterium islandicum]|uniref:RNase adapter RapZ n=1 Tax=Fervidobacterium islandicum TaxID=2423 RepID=A0AAI8GDG5_FERIS|nr:RNase adapter RapZ [Fervidobacterium islandicum]AMW33086.1 RNase adapter RapZ [Fervidobacterium islandicum]